MGNMRSITIVAIFTGFIACSGGNSRAPASDTGIADGDLQSLDAKETLDGSNDGTNELPEGVFVNWDVDSTVDTEGEVAPKCPGGFNCSCDTLGDCDSQWCVIVDPTKGDKRCTFVCNAGDCPVNWGCVNVSSGGQDAIFLCMPKTSVLCKRKCQGDGDCGLKNLCASVGTHKYCLTACQDDNNCPDNYTCKDVKNFDGSVTSKQCWPVTDSCICGVDVDYQTDPANCGKCEHKCEYANATPLCATGKCQMGACNKDWWDIDKDPSNGCEYNCTKTADTDTPDVKYVDADCDGIDGEKVHSVFVDASKGDDDNTKGDIFHPFKTIAAAMAFAQGTKDRHTVLVSRGLYNEQIIMQDGISLYGGYNADKGWKRDIDLYKTAVMYNGQEPLAIRTVVAKNIVDPTVLDGFFIKSASNPQSGGSSYGIWVYSCSKNFVISNNTIESGNGGDGDNGESGNNGQNGGDGGSGGDGQKYGGPWYGVGCGNGNVPDTAPGGSVGKGYCNNSGGGGGTGAPRGASGGVGGSGNPPGMGGSGGTGGGSTGSGTNGTPGTTGSEGKDGKGGKLTTALSPDKLWLPGNGADGQDGTPGGGGGGAGGGGPDSNCCCYQHGGGGGGGGGGGCPGTKGMAGSGGGGSFALFLVDSQSVIQHNVLIYNSGGNGGNGGKAGKPGKGGKGGKGGLHADNAGDGGNGGAGGAGGNAGAGAGGAGGPSIGIAIFGDNSNPNCSDNDFEPGGFQGMGGTGGSTGVTPNNGADGISKKIWGATDKCVDPDTKP